MAKTTTSNISLRMDSNLKAAAEALYEELGMNISTAFNIFVRQSLREQMCIRDRMIHVGLSGKSSKYSVCFATSSASRYLASLTYSSGISIPVSYTHLDVYKRQI